MFKLLNKNMWKLKVKQIKIREKNLRSLIR